MSRSRAEPTLKARALRALARREHSRAELERKLAPHAESPEQLHALLDRLMETGLLSNERFAQSVVHRRASTRGVAVVRHELRAHGLSDEAVAEHVATLQHTEFERARALWLRRFGSAPRSLAERAKQMRFMLARGFSADVVGRIVGGRAAELD
ncbi:MAG: recombination regulator RecX [Burkholderiaceae bacterium]|jgi:regulatory protein|nr:recombination regulator RecX [Burkholderiaceae bacterium]